MTFAEFMDLALYDERVGYYRRDAARVGYAPGTDFFTASTNGPVFGELVCAAVAALLPGRTLADFTFVEIGAEPGKEILTDVPHPFRAVQTVRLGDKPTVTGPVVMFSNELFDAQPVRRLIFRGGAWRERGVALVDGMLCEIEIPGAPALPLELPAAAEGYQLDVSFAAVDLLEKLASGAWHGLFIAFDYGKSWRELIEATPGGTIRAYYRHTQSTDLCARPGLQDLTAHVCWDWLGDALRRHGFATPVVESQETFLVRHAGAAIAAISRAEALRFSARKQALMQLLHPAHLGQKFQVLHATR